MKMKTSNIYSDLLIFRLEPMPGYSGNIRFRMEQRQRRRYNIH